MKTIEQHRAEQREEKERLVEDLNLVLRAGRLVKGRWSKTTPLRIVRATWERTMETEWSIFERTGR